MTRKKIIRKLTASLLVLVWGCLVLAMFGIYVALSDSSLWSAASSGNALAAWFLIARGSDVNARDKDGDTPLFYAAAKGHPWVVRVLLKSGADATIVNSHGETALCWAIRSGEDESTEVMELLIQAGGLRKTRPSYLFYRLSNGHTATAHILTLLKHGVDPNARYPDGMTILIDFASDGGASEVAALADHGADVNLAANDGRTALSEAVTWGYVDTVKCLLDHGANVNTKFKDRSMIELAIDKKTENSREGGPTSDYDAVISLLQQHGANFYRPQTQPSQKTPNAAESEKKPLPG